MDNLISIIVPVYNVEEYVERCIDSIITQTYTNIEIIIVDDGSIDSSSLIVDEIAHKDQRIIVVHQKNGGLSAARNTGIKTIAEIRANSFIFMKSPHLGKNPFPFPGKNPGEWSFRFE